MAEQIYTTEQMPYPHYGQKSYRIEIKQTDHGWMQRHIWTRADDSVDAEKWIPSPISGPDSDMYRSGEVKDGK